MPPEGVARCRAACARFVGRPTCVVHGNPNNPGNVSITANRVALIDWDQSHVDVPELDLALPHNAAGLDEGAYDIAAQAPAAWEAAVCWDHAYAVKRLAESSRGLSSGSEPRDRVGSHGCVVRDSKCRFADGRNGSLIQRRPSTG